MGTRRYKSHPQSSPGNFYVVNNECTSCGAPHAVAPELIGWAEAIDDFSHCIWKRQPRTADEVEDAIGAVLVSEVACHRYAGDDPQVIARLGPDYCDAAPLSRLASVNVGPPSPPTFALTPAGGSPLDRVITALRLLATRLSQKG